MRVLGFDPGTIRMGYGVVDSDPRPEAGDYGVIALPRFMPLEQRLYQMYTHVLNMISIFQPDVIAVEEPFLGKLQKTHMVSTFQCFRCPPPFQTSEIWPCPAELRIFSEWRPFSCMEIVFLQCKIKKIAPAARKN